MILFDNNIKRYAVYVFYDKNGKADRYCDFFLQSLKKEVDFLQIIVNGEIDSSSYAKFEIVADDILVRENEGYDVTAYKVGILKQGFEKLEKYDEVIICNNTLYGPLYPLNEMFDKMAARDVDFWGLTYFHGVDFDPFGTVEYGYLPRHIQSFFMVFRQSLVKSRQFQKFWRELPTVKGYEQAIGLFEASFTKRFADYGFQWDVFADSSDLEGYTLDPLRDFPKYMIEKKKCPFMKKRTFYHEYGEAMERSGGEAASEVFKYIRDKLDYDVDLIWENLLRTQNMADVKKRLQLNYVLSSRYRIKRKNSIKKIALILHIYYIELAESCRKYVESVPQNVDVFITVPDKKRLNVVKRVFKDLPNKTEYRITGNIGRDVAPFIVGCRDVIENYDLICKIHGKKVYQVKPMSLGESWAYECFENLLGNKCLVENIIALFENNTRLGILSPPIPHHGPYYPTIGKSEWGENYKIVKKLAKQLDIKVDIDKEKEPNAPLGSMFWIRTDALKPLFRYDWKYSDMPKEPIADDNTVLHGIERIYPFCAQEAGYYCADIVSSSYAPIEMNSLKFQKSQIINAEKKLVGNVPLRELVATIGDASHVFKQRGN